MGGLLNPKDRGRTSLTRPAETNQGGNQRRWYDPTKEPRLYAQDMNRLLAQFRTALDHFEIADEEGDDHALRKIVEAVNAAYSISGGTAKRTNKQRFEKTTVDVLEFLGQSESASIITDPEKCTALWNRASSAMRSELAAGRSLILDGGGRTYHVFSVDLTGLQGRSWGLGNVRFRGFEYRDSSNNLLNVPVLDFTESRFGNLHNKIYVRGDQSLPPAIGALFSRGSAGSPAGTHDLWGFEAFGNFRGAAYLNYASEVQMVFGLRAANSYHARGATVAMLVADDAMIMDKFGWLPQSLYRTLPTGLHSLSSTNIIGSNIQRGPAYTVSITGISKANPAVVTISTANMSSIITNSGFANGARIYIESLTASDPAWAALLRFRTFEVANVNAGAGTFELVEVDTSGVAGTFTSAVMNNDTGPALVVGGMSWFQEIGNYKTAYSDAKILLDMRSTGQTDNDRTYMFSGHNEPAGPHLLDIKIDSTASRRLRNLRIDDDRPAYIESPILVSGGSGSGDLLLNNFEANFGREAQASQRLFTNPDRVQLFGGRVVVPNVVWHQSRAAFKGNNGRLHWVFPTGEANETAARLANLTRSSTATIAADTSLSIAVLANKKYRFELRIFYDSVPAAGFKFGISGPASPANFRAAYSGVTPEGTQIAQGRLTAYETSGVAVTHASGTDGGFLRIAGVMEVGATAGTLAFMWSQNVSDAGTTRVRTQSTMDVTLF